MVALLGAEANPSQLCRAPCIHGRVKIQQKQPRPKTMKNISGKVLALFVIVGLVALWAFGSRIAEYNDAGNILFIQYPSGSLGIYSDQGFHPRWWGKSEAWKKSKQYSY